MEVSRLRELEVLDPEGGGPVRPIAAASGAARVGDRLFVVADADDPAQPSPLLQAVL